MLFELVPGGFSYLINYNNYNLNWKKLLGFRNMQEKLENIITRLCQEEQKNKFHNEMTSLMIELHQDIKVMFQNFPL